MPAVRKIAIVADTVLVLLVAVLAAPIGSAATRPRS